METIQPVNRPNSNRAAVTPAPTDRAARGGAGQGAGAPAEALKIDEIAPITIDQPAADPVMYRFTLNWRAILKDPARPPAPGDGEPVAMLNEGVER